MKKLALSLSFLSLHSVSAATISWIAHGTVTDNHDISLAGTLVHATTYGSGGATVNVTVGSEVIPFEGETAFAGGIVTTPNSTVTVAGRTAQTGFFNSAGTTVSANFETVLDSFAFDGPNPKVLTLNNLTVGQEYQIQLFVSDDRGCCSARTQLWSDNAVVSTGNETVTFTHVTSPYDIGTFVAGATSETIYGHGVGQNQNILNGYVLRAIPEPSSIALTALAGLALLRRRR